MTTWCVWTFPEPLGVGTTGVGFSTPGLPFCPSNRTDRNYPPRVWSISCSPGPVGVSVRVCVSCPSPEGLGKGSSRDPNSLCPSPSTSGNRDSGPGHGTHRPDLVGTTGTDPNLGPGDPRTPGNKSVVGTRTRPVTGGGANGAEGGL